MVEKQQIKKEKFYFTNKKEKSTYSGTLDYQNPEFIHLEKMSKYCKYHKKYLSIYSSKIPENISNIWA